MSLKLQIQQVSLSSLGIRSILNPSHCLCYVSSTSLKCYQYIYIKLLNKICCSVGLYYRYRLVLPAVFDVDHHLGDLYVSLNYMCAVLYKGSSSSYHYESQNVCIQNFFGVSFVSVVRLVFEHAVQKWGCLYCRPPSNCSP